MRVPVSDPSTRPKSALCDSCVGATSYAPWASQNVAADPWSTGPPLDASVTIPRAGWIPLTEKLLEWDRFYTEVPMVRWIESLEQQRPQAALGLFALCFVVLPGIAAIGLTWFVRFA